MIKLYDYTNGEKVVLESFDSWLDAEKALDWPSNPKPPKFPK